MYRGFLEWTELPRFVLGPLLVRSRNRNWHLVSFREFIQKHDNKNEASKIIAPKIRETNQTDDEFLKMFETSSCRR